LTAAYVPVANQEERGAGYRFFTEKIAQAPYFVGAHYFQYIDEPITGRNPDRENSFNGFVRVTDVPYQEIVQAAKETNWRLYKIHAGLETPTMTMPKADPTPGRKPGP